MVTRPSREQQAALDETTVAVQAMRRGENPPGHLFDMERFGCYVEIINALMLVLAAHLDGNGQTDPRSAAAKAVCQAWDALKSKVPELAEAVEPSAQPVIVTMSKVMSEPVRWLWWPYIAIGKVCMLDGDPGIGKTLLMTQLAASLSHGHPLPDQQGQPTLDPGGPQATLLLSTEDGLADTLKPRLEAAGADCSQVHVLTGWRDAEDAEDEQKAFTLQHLPILEAAMPRYQARLVVIDPIQAYLGPIDMHRANETRPLLAALTKFAERHSCAVVCIRHPSKPGQHDGKAIHRGLGSIDFIGAARTALFVEQHPTDTGKALMAQSKSNIGPFGRTQVFSKAEGVFRWCGVSRLSAEVMAGSGRGPDRYAFLPVVCWLEEHLKSGVPKAATEIEQALSEEGYSLATAKRAKKALGIVSQQTPRGWRWTLPALTHLPPPTSVLAYEPLESLEPLEPLEPLSQNQSLTYSNTAEEAEAPEAQEEPEAPEAHIVFARNDALQPPTTRTNGPPQRERREPWPYPKPVSLVEASAQRQATIAAVKQAGVTLTHCSRCGQPLVPGQFQELLEDETLHAECHPCQQNLGG